MGKDKKDIIFDDEHAFIIRHDQLKDVNLEEEQERKQTIDEYFEPKYYKEYRKKMYGELTKIYDNFSRLLTFNLKKIE